MSIKRAREGEDYVIDLESRDIAPFVDIENPIDMFGVSPGQRWVHNTERAASIAEQNALVRKRDALRSNLTCVKIVQYPNTDLLRRDETYYRQWIDVDRCHFMAVACTLFQEMVRSDTGESAMKAKQTELAKFLESMK